MDNYDNYNNDNPNNSEQSHDNNGNYNPNNQTPYNGGNQNYNQGGPNNGYNPGGPNNGYNPGGPNNGYNPYPPQPPYKQQNNMALAAMIVGIFSLLSCCIPPLQFALSVVGILLVIFSKKGGKPWSGFAIAGLVLSILSLIISIVMVIYVIFAFQMMRDPQYAPLFNEIYQMYESAPIQ